MSAARKIADHLQRKVQEPREMTLAEIIQDLCDNPAKYAAKRADENKTDETNVTKPGTLPMISS